MKLSLCVLLIFCLASGAPPAALAKKAGPGEMLRFNAVDTWRASVDMRVHYKSKVKKSSDCRVDSYEEIQNLHASLVLGHAVSKLIKDYEKKEGQEGPVSRVFWGGGGSKEFAGLVSGSIRQTSRFIKKQSCKNYQEYIVTSGEDTQSAKPAAMLMIFGQEYMPMLEGHYYIFSVDARPYKGKVRGYKRYKQDEGWKTERVNETTELSMRENPRPLRDGQTESVESVMGRMPGNSIRIIEQAQPMINKNMKFLGGIGAELRSVLNEAKRELSVAEKPEEPGPDEIADGMPKVPKSGLILSRRQNVRIENEWDIIEIAVNWTFRPDKGMEYELEIEPENYKKWRPEGNVKRNERGNVMIVHARLVDPKTGKKANAPAESIVFELENVSRHPGSAMNWPVIGADKTPDLRFEKKENPGNFEISDEGQKIEDVTGKQTMKMAGVNESTVRLSSFDWGGRADLKVTAKIMVQGGEPVEIAGYLKGERDKEIISIPERADNSFIADWWKKDMGVSGKPDASDDEDKPAGDGDKGDGLTLFEEYRGFYTTPMGSPEAKHSEGDPKRKDYFIANEASDAEGGLFRFSQVSGLAVHLLKKNEMNKGREVNFNHSEGPHVVDQHGVILTDDPDPKSRVSSVHGPQKRPGSPGEIENITIADSTKHESTDFEGNERIFRDKTIVHELLHASCVWHHGESDLGSVTWDVAGGSGTSRLVESSRNTQGIFGHYAFPIEVYDEDGKRITGKYINAIRKYGKPLKKWVGVKNGQHSGSDHCVMRYAAAGAYIPDTGFSLFGEDIRVAIHENIGWDLCSSASGTGVNDSARSPKPYHGPRYYDAASGRGNCRAQVCVNDKFMGDGKHKRGAWFE